MMWYARVLCHHPYAVLSSVIVVVGTCLALSLTARPLPSFDAPALGFESRGTVISERATAWENLKESTGPRGPLIVNPLGDPHFKASHPPPKPNGDPPKHKHKACLEMTPDGPVQVDNCAEIDNKTRVDSPTDERPVDIIRKAMGQYPSEGDSSSGMDTTSSRGSGGNVDAASFYDKWRDLSSGPTPGHEEGSHSEENHPHHHHMSPDGFFCNNLVPDYGHIVIENTDSTQNLFTLSNLKAICELDTVLRSPPEMQSICQTSSGNTCCPSWSLPNYVALLSNKTSCRDLDEKDVTEVHRLLRRCARFLDLQLEKGCGMSSCRHVPKACLENDSVFTILHYLTDAAFLQPQVGSYGLRQMTPVTVNDPKLTKTPQSPHGPHGPREPTGPILSKITPIPMITVATPLNKRRHHLQQLGQRQQEDRLALTAIFLPVARSSNALPLFEALRKRDLSVRNVSVVAMDLGLKNTLFDKLLLADSFLLGVGCGVVMILIWFYTGSLFITVITIITVACSLLIAYFLYVFIYEIAFFPYMNILTAVIAIGLGADDTFVYCRVWNLAKQDKNCGTMVKLVSDAIHHAAASICVTSFTTAAAFLASFTSPITAVKCFSIFAGTVVIANLVLMVTWVPACVVIAERWGASSCCLCVPPAPAYAAAMNPKCSLTCALPLRLCYSCTETGKVFFEKVLPWMIVKPRHFWIVSLGSLACCSAFVVFYYPGLRLPDSKEFQLFDRKHPFEQYDLKYKYQFWFERNLQRDIVNRLPIRIVWGILPVDNGDYLNPENKGTLEFDDTFDVSHPQSQLWLLNFCRDLRNQTFFMSTLGPLLPHCFIETFKISMERRCVDPTNGYNRSPCCENSTFPFTREVFDQCIHQGISELYETPREFFIPGVAGPKFSKTTGKIKAIVIEYDSTYIWSLSYDVMDRFFREVETWVEGQMKTAPPGLRNGWFTSYLSFYDVQRSLSIGTGMAVAVAVSVCLAVLLLTTLNFVVSLLAIVSVAAVMVVTLAALVLLGWRLNVLESVTVSVAIGLAVDLTLHYGVAYRLSPEPERAPAVAWAAARLGSPVFMAALTSVGAGVAMLPSNVLAYVHVGAFLTILSTASYMYATFFYLPLLRIMGPQRGFGQLSYPRCSYFKRCFRGNKDPRVDKTVYQQTFISESTLSTSSNCLPNTAVPVASISGGGPSSDTHELEPLTACRKASSRRRHPSVSRLSSGTTVVPSSPDEPPVPVVPHLHIHRGQVINGGAGGGSGGRVGGRSGSLSSSLSGRERRERAALRKVSLPSPTGGIEGELGEPSPKHAVEPTLSTTTILYSEPESEYGFHPHTAHGSHRPPPSPSYLHQSAPVQLVSPKRKDSCGSRGSLDPDGTLA